MNKDELAFNIYVLSVNECFIKNISQSELTYWKSIFERSTITLNIKNIYQLYNKRVSEGYAEQERKRVLTEAYGKPYITEVIAPELSLMDMIVKFDKEINIDTFAYHLKNNTLDNNSPMLTVPFNFNLVHIYKGTETPTITSLSLNVFEIVNPFLSSKTCLISGTITNLNTKNT